MINNNNNNYKKEKWKDNWILFVALFFFTFYSYSLFCFFSTSIDQGVYGDILKVKIMYNRRDNALMQFKSYEQAMNAVTKMDKVKLFDKVLSVGMSKFPEIQIPVKNVI